MTERPETRFTRVDDLVIAYQVVGPAAEFDAVFVPGWFPLVASLAQASEVLVMNTVKMLVLGSGSASPIARRTS